MLFEIELKVLASYLFSEMDEILCIEVFRISLFTMNTVYANKQEPLIATKKSQPSESQL